MVYSSIFRLLKPIPLLWGLKSPHSHRTKHHVPNFPSTYISVPFIFPYLFYLYHSIGLNTVPLYLYHTVTPLHRYYFSWSVLICKVFLYSLSSYIWQHLSFDSFIYPVSTRTRSGILYLPYLYGVHHNSVSFQISWIFPQGSYISTSPTLSIQFLPSHSNLISQKIILFQQI